MKNHTPIVIIVFYLSFSLSGCINQDNIEVDEHIEIVSHQLKYLSEFEKALEVTGVLKNIGSEMISKLTVKVDFYNVDNYYLISKFDNIYNLPSLQNISFRVVYEEYEQYYHLVSFYKITIDDFELI